MFSKTIWKPGGIFDVQTCLEAVKDPEAYLFLPENRWQLIKSPKALHELNMEAQSNPADHKTLVAVICIETIRSLPWLTHWHKTVHVALFLTQASVTAFPEGPVSSQDRFLLADASDLLTNRLFDRQPDSIGTSDPRFTSS